VNDPLARRFCPSWLRRFVQGEDGMITVQNLFLTVAACAIGAAGLDVTSFFQARTELQVAADVAAHSALYRRNQSSVTPGAARTDAIARVQYGMPSSRFGEVVNAADITFGTYNPASKTFTANETSRRAALAIAGRNEADDNAVSSFLFRIVGIDQVDVRTEAVAVRYSPGCLTNGFAAKNAVKITSGNQFFDDFCIHSNSRVELNNSNGFETGVVVSMPNTSDLKMPSAGWTSNTGLVEALREGQYDFQILDRIATGDDLQVQLRTMGTVDQEEFAPWLHYSTLNTVNKTTVTPADFTRPAGSVYSITGCGGKDLTLGPGTYHDMILTTDCSIKMSGQVILDQAIISTTSTDSKSVHANSGGGSSIQIGRYDTRCTPGGEAAIITRGGVDTSATLSMYGGQIIASGTVNFAAHLEGYGLSIVSGNEILGNTDIDAYGCPTTGMEHAIEGRYFRLAL